MSEENTLEEGKRLSESMLWSILRDYYDRSGLTAWNSGSIPFYITNTPRLAAAWADVAVGYLRDLAWAELLDFEAPVYMVELGSGSGRHGFLLLRALEELAQAYPLRNLKVCLVLADLSQRNLDFYRSHPRFETYLEAGRLDFACFNAEQGETLELQYSGTTLRAGELKNPMIFVANYLLDSLSQDAFRVESGELKECLPRLVAPAELDMDDPKLLKKIKVKYDYHEVDPDYYEDETWNAILEEYRDRLGDTAFSFPVGPLNCLANLGRVAGGRMLFLTADKAWSRIADLVGLDDPDPVLHGGGFSMTVNFHALDVYLAKMGGLALHSTLRDAVLEASAFVLEPGLEDFPESGLAFEKAIEDFGPIDFFSVKECLQGEVREPSLRLAIDLLRLSRWDPQTLYDFSEALLERVEHADPDVQREVRIALLRVWDNFYSIGDEIDVPFEIARIFYRLDHYLDAVKFYRVSLDMFGYHKMTVHNVGLCYYYMRELEEALHWFDRALELDADYGPSREWRLRVKAEMGEVSEAYRPLYASGERLRAVPQSPRKTTPVG